jgi:hypothetical protein
MYVGVNYEYFKDTYFKLGFVNSYNLYDTDRFDSISTIFNSKSNYYDLLLNLEIGQNIIDDKRFILKAGLYGNYDAIKMLAYKENSDLGYAYDDNLYSSTQGGIILSGLIKADTDDDIQINFNTKFGYKLNIGNPQFFVLNIDSTSLLVSDIEVYGSGLYIKPQISLSYTQNNISLQASYSYEYMQNNYIDNSINFIFKYAL